MTTPLNVSEVNPGIGSRPVGTAVSIFNGCSARDRRQRQPQPEHTVYDLIGPNALTPEALENKANWSLTSQPSFLHGNATFNAQIARTNSFLCNSSG